jgi:putative sterol carrier protein
MYYDRDVVVEPIKAGPDIPEEERWQTRSVTDIDNWNARRLAERPAGYTVADALAQMQSVRDELRELTAGMTDDDLEGQVWCPSGLFRGWRPIRAVLPLCSTHNYSEFTQLRSLMKLNKPAPSAELTHGFLSFFTGMMGNIADTSAFEDKPFTLIRDFRGPGGGAWTVHVEDGECTVSEGRTRKADMEMSLSPEYMGVLFGVQNPIMGILTGKVKIRGYRHMRKMGQLFSPGDPDEVMEPIVSR